jgi:hypothetical protein
MSTETTKIETAAVVANTAEKVADQLGLHTAGQRKTNLIWERTQSVIALAVVLTTCSGIIALSLIRFWHDNLGPERLPSFPPEWWTILGLVIGFYFGRTNHSRLAPDGGKTTT